MSTLTINKIILEPAQIANVSVNIKLSENYVGAPNILNVSKNIEPSGLLDTPIIQDINETKEYKIKATLSDGGQFVKIINKLDVNQRTYPLNIDVNTTLQDEGILLNFNLVNDAISYVFEIYKDNTKEAGGLYIYGATVIKNNNNSINIPISNISILNETYYVRIRSIYNNGVSSWSPYISYEKCKVFLLIDSRVENILGMDYHQLKVDISESFVQPITVNGALELTTGAWMAADVIIPSGQLTSGWQTILPLGIVGPTGIEKINSISPKQINNCHLIAQ